MSENGVRFQAVGDIAFGDHPLCAGFGTHSRMGKEFSGFAFEHVAATLKRAELLFGNLECTLSESGLRVGDYSSIQMRGDSSYLEALKAAGFDVLNHANNHSMQHGATPFIETVEMLRRTGIQVCGVAGRSHRTCLPVTIERGGLSIGFLGYSLRPRQYFTREPLYAEGNPPEILNDVAQLRPRCDVLVVSLHWGDEFICDPSPADVALAHAVTDAGADLIVGHHPHVLRGLERRGGSVIVYSLGNFVCDMLWGEDLRESVIFECRLTRNGIEDPRLAPVRIEDDYRPRLLEKDAAAAVSARIDQLSLALGRVPRSSPDALERYAERAEAALRQERRRAHRYFLRNVHRFPKGILWQQIRTWAHNRLAERGLLASDAQ